MNLESDFEHLTVEMKTFHVKANEMPSWRESSNNLRCWEAWLDWASFTIDDGIPLCPCVQMSFCISMLNLHYSFACCVLFWPLLLTFHPFRLFGTTHWPQMYFFLHDQLKHGPLSIRYREPWAVKPQNDAGLYVDAVMAVWNPLIECFKNLHTSFCLLLTAFCPIPFLTDCLFEWTNDV